MAINNLKINKIKFEYLLKNIKPVEHIEDKQEITVDIDELTMDEEYKLYIKEFVKKTSANFNFNNPNEKLETLTIKLKTVLQTLLFPTSEAEYNSLNNKIYVGKNIDDSIYHELFHVFTTYKKNILSTVSGFNYTNIHTDIARSLNEGYTDLLANRYFDSVVSYMIEANIARKTEIILSEKNMENFYASNNLYAIIKFLSKFSSEEEAIAFISSTDKLSIYRNNIKKSLQIMNILSNYLVDVYVNVLVEFYSRGKFDKEDINIFLSIFKEEFTNYAFYEDYIEKEYLRSSDYLDITSKLSNDHFQKQLRKKVLTK